MNIVLVVTFAWSLVAAAASIWYHFLRCVHAWELVDKTELPSKLEVIRKFWPPKQMGADELMMAAKVCATIVVRCPKCGGCKIIRMSNE
jgi:hypothetical protein